MTDKVMIDDHILNQINDLREYRNGLVAALKDLNGSWDRVAVYFDGVDHSEGGHSIDRGCMEEFLESHISDVDDELKSLGFSPLPITRGRE